MRKLNILILGVGGNVSQGIIKAILLSKIPCRIIGACVTPDNVGFYLCDKALISPYANTNEFIPWLVSVCKKESIDIILTGVEEIIYKIMLNYKILSADTNSIFVATEYEKLLIGQDKYKTCEWLRENGCNYPRYCLTEDKSAVSNLISDVGYPFILKPRSGKGSIGVKKILNKDDLYPFLGNPDYVLEELIGTEQDEYTVACYCNKDKKLCGLISLHRILKNGSTDIAEVVYDDKIIKESVKICNAFQPTGPLNIQMRLNKNCDPICFELNVRFSGTTPIRANFGFNDVSALIKEYMYGINPEEEFKIKQGKAFRYINELYIFNKPLIDNEGTMDLSLCNIYSDSLRKNI